MPRFISVGRADRIGEGCGVTVEVEGRRIAVFRRGANLFAVDDRCSHMDASLAGGRLIGDCIVCPWHGAVFNALTGTPGGPPARGGIRVWPCRVEGDDLLIGV